MKSFILKWLAVLALFLSIVIFPIIIVLLIDDYEKSYTDTQKESTLRLLLTLIYSK